MKKFLFFLIFFSLFFGVFLKSGFSENAPQSSYNVSSYSWILLRTTFSLILILVLIYFSARIFLGKINARFIKKDFFIFERLPLEPQVTLYLVKIGAKIFLLGVGGKRITLINTFSENDLPVFEKTSSEQSKTFPEILGKFIEKIKKTQTGES